MKSKVEVQARLVSGEASLPGLQMVASHSVLTGAYVCSRVGRGDWNMEERERD